MMPSRLILLIATAFSLQDKKDKTADATISCSVPEVRPVCVFKTLVGLEFLDTADVTFNTALTDAAIKNGLCRVLQAQENDGGRGPVLQSALANNVPESVEPADVK